MTAFSPPAPATRLLSLPDAYGAPLADFDHYPTLDLLHVGWHGHLTTEALVRGVEAGMQLFDSQNPPSRILSNHALVTGDWADALPWLQYEWLPVAQARGVRALAHVLAPDTASQLISYPGSAEFTAAITQAMHTASFRNLGPAWQWLTHR